MFKLIPITNRNYSRRVVDINKIIGINENRKEKEKPIILPELKNKRPINVQKRLLTEDNSNLIFFPIINNNNYLRNNIYDSYSLRKIETENNIIIPERNHIHLNLSLDLQKKINKINIEKRKRNKSGVIYSNLIKKNNPHIQNLKISNHNNIKKEEYKIDNYNYNNKSKFKLIWENALIKSQKDEKIKYLEKLRKKEEEEQLELKKRMEKIEKEKERMEMENIRKKLERKKSIEIMRERIGKRERLERQRSENLIKQKEEKIISLVEESKIIMNHKKELELKEANLDIKSKHENTLNILNRLVRQYLDIYKTDNIQEILELINEIGKTFQKEIDYDKEYSKDNILTIKEAIKDENIEINFLGLLGEHLLKNYDINSIIEKTSKDVVFMDGVFKVLLSKYSILPKFEIKINSEKVKSNILKDPKELFNLINKFKEKIMKEYNIPPSKIYFISYRIDLCEFSLILLDKYNIFWKKYEILFHINIKQKTLLENIKLSHDFFENKFNKEPKSWKKKPQNRGGEFYYPPSGWKGISLKVLDLFDNGDNTWLGNEGKNGEWAVAYHGIGKGNEIEKLMNIILNNLKTGPVQRHQNSPNARDNEKSTVDKGVYLGKNIKVAKKFANLITFGKKKKFYRLVVMCRVNPGKIRQPIEEPLYWVVDDNYDCVRPYRILFKECNKKSNKKKNKNIFESI